VSYFDILNFIVL